MCSDRIFRDICYLVPLFSETKWSINFVHLLICTTRQNLRLYRQFLTVKLSWVLPVSYKHFLEDDKELFLWSLVFLQYFYNCQEAAQLLLCVPFVIRVIFVVLNIYLRTTRRVRICDTTNSVVDLKFSPILIKACFFFAYHITERASRRTDGQSNTALIII